MKPGENSIYVNIGPWQTLKIRKQTPRRMQTNANKRTSKCERNEWRLTNKKMERADERTEKFNYVLRKTLIKQWRSTGKKFPSSPGRSRTLWAFALSMGRANIRYRAWLTSWFQKVIGSVLLGEHASTSCVTLFLLSDDFFYYFILQNNILLLFLYF